MADLEEEGNFSETYEDAYANIYDFDAPLEPSTKPCTHCYGLGGWCLHGRGVRHVKSCGTYRTCSICKGSGRMPI